MRSVGRRPSRRGNEEIAVDNGVSNRRRGAGRSGNRGNRRNNGGRRRGGRGGRRRGGRGGRGRGRPAGRAPVRMNRRERRLIGRLAAANGAFSLQMYTRLKQDHQEFVFSPHSTHTALTMTYMGARERTAKQMRKVLGLKGLKNDTVHVAYAALIERLNNSGNVTLNVANAVYVKPNLPIEEAFRFRLQSLYRAAFDHFDMAAEGGPEAPINAWVANQTHDKIRDLLGAGTIDDLTALIIVNAIYFKGAWKDKFDAELTSEQDFHRDDGSTPRVKMMRRTGRYNYSLAQDLSAHIVELPYQDGQFSMFVILPEARNRMDEVEQRLTVASLNNHLQNLRSTKIELHLPKFKSESKFSLKNTLKRMGMRLPFSNRAKFDGICSTQDLKITDVIHQAMVEVSEEGTEAAASTAVIIGLRSFPRPTPVIRADHPFLYAIRDNLTNTWLFVGKYSAKD
ncbi:hypothetical protein ACOMHN_003780 [Nucella lapillus]